MSVAVQQNQVIEKSLQNAFASNRMEGLVITPDIEKNCRRVLYGEITLQERVRELKAKYSTRRNNVV